MNQRRLRSRGNSSNKICGNIYGVICASTVVLVLFHVFLVSNLDDKVDNSQVKAAIPDNSFSDFDVLENMEKFNNDDNFDENDVNVHASKNTKGAATKLGGCEGRSVQVFYYAWWANPDKDGQWSHWDHVVLPHWTDSVNKKYPLIGTRHRPENGDIAARFYPELGPYSSASTSIVREHLWQMKDAGIDTVVYSWYPAGMSDDNGISGNPDALFYSFLNEAAIIGLSVALHFEPYNGRDADSVWKDVEYINRKYGNHPSLCKRKRLNSQQAVPLVYVYDSYHISPAEWKRVLRDRGTGNYLRSMTDAFMVGLLVEKQHLSVLADSGFDGMFTYFASSGFTWGSTPSNWDSIATFCVKKDILFIPSIGPGYDDTGVRPWNARNSKNRNRGLYYKEMYKYALSTLKIQTNVQPVLSITSYNEWHEGTQIEPAVTRQGYLDYGLDLSPHGYLQLTKEFSQKWHDLR